MTSLLVKYFPISSLILILTLTTVEGLGLKSSSKYQRPLSQWTVGVVNKLGGGETLLVHCKSKDDDLGEHTLAAEQSFSWSFKENLLRTTLYWCNLSSSTNQHATLNVFWPEKEEWLASRCNFTSCIWVAQNDGIYLLNLPTGSLELVHKWE